MEGTTIGVVGVGCCVFTVTVVLPDFVVSWEEVATMVAVPVAAGVKTPVLLIDPMLVGLTDQLTKLLKLPVPCMVAVQVEV